MLFNIRHTHRADKGTEEDLKLVEKIFDPPITQVGKE